MTEAGIASIITHGEPHTGNLIRVADGFVLVGWDTVALAPNERDRWVLDGGSGDVLARYAKESGGSVDCFTEHFRSPHQRSEDTEKARRALHGYLRTVDDSGVRDPG